MNVNWSGLGGENWQDILEFLDDKELLGGIVGSTADHHTAPYSLTEEFVAVYRMHPLMPDDFAFHSVVTGRLLEQRTLLEIAGMRTPAIAERLTMPDLFYSFGCAIPVQWPTTTRDICRTSRSTAASISISRWWTSTAIASGAFPIQRIPPADRKPPAKSFDELTDNFGVAEADSRRLQRRPREGGSHDRPVRRTAARGLRVQQTRRSDLHPDGLRAA